MKKYRVFCGSSAVGPWTSYIMACHTVEECLVTKPVGLVTIVRQSDKLQVSATIALERSDLTTDQLFSDYGRPDTV